jgi:medium-chain acyl-[acyl-carrier-protein] hydrolase
MLTMMREHRVLNLKENPGAKLRLFCFPYAGGGSAVFRQWQEELPPSVEVCPVHLPGRPPRLREPALTQIPPLVRSLARDMRPYFDKPFALFGHSMGALISFEMARLLRREYGVEPLHLFVSGRSAPQLGVKEAKTHDLPQPEFIEELRGLNGTPPEVFEHPELLAMMLPLLRADFSVCQTYAYTDEPPLNLPITAFGGLQDTNVSRAELEPWGEQTSESFMLRMIHGDHFFINTSRQILLRALALDLLQHIQGLP